MNLKLNFIKIILLSTSIVLIVGCDKQNKKDNPKSSSLLTQDDQKIPDSPVQYNPKTPETPVQDNPKTPETLATGKSHLIYPKNDENLESIIKKSFLSCDTGSYPCNPSVGMLVGTYSDGSVYTCSFFLVGTDTIITNSHCVPDELKAPQTSCSGRMWFNLATTPSYASDEIDCDQVIMATNISDKSTDKQYPDYAVLKLLRSPIPARPVLNISREGFQDEKKYTIDKSTPTSAFQALGVLQRSVCTAKFGSFMSSLSNDKTSVNITMGDCDVVHGNSGSPILNERGDVVGIIEKTVLSDSINNLTRANNLSILESVAKMGIATNFACAQLPAEAKAPNISADCSKSGLSQKENSQLVMTIVTNQSYHKINDLVKSLESSFDPNFHWTAVQLNKSKSDSKSIYSFVPSCISSKSNYINEYSYLFFVSNSKTLNLSLPTFNLKIGFNRYMQLNVHVELGAELNAVLNFSPREFNINKKSKLVETAQLPGEYSSQEVFNDTISFCSDEQYESINKK